VNAALLVAVIGLLVGSAGAALAVISVRRSAAAAQALGRRLDEMLANAEAKDADVSRQADHLLAGQRELSANLSNLHAEFESHRKALAQLEGHVQAAADKSLTTAERVEVLEDRLNELKVVLAASSDTLALLASRRLADRTELETEMGELLRRQGDMLRAEMVASIADR